MRSRSVVVALGFVVAFSVNPAFVAGCTLFSFGEKEAVSLVPVVGAHRTYELSRGGEGYTLVVDVRQSRERRASRDEPGLVSSAHACGDRTFVRSASACIDSTTVPVEGTMRLARTGSPAPLYDGPVVGELVLFGTTLGEGELRLGRAGTTDGPDVYIDTRDAKAFSVKYVAIRDGGERSFEYHRPEPR